jgi:hypothetical protein
MNSRSVTSRASRAAGRPARRGKRTTAPRRAAGDPVRPSWHDWRFELVPQNAEAGSESGLVPPPPGRASRCDGCVDHGSPAGSTKHAHQPHGSSIPTSGGDRMTTTIRSRKVRRILRLEARADWQAAREARAASRATLLGRRVDTLRGEARALEASLTGGQCGELARARAAAGAAAPVEPPARRPRVPPSL